MGGEAVGEQGHGFVRRTCLRITALPQKQNLTPNRKQSLFAPIEHIAVCKHEKQPGSHGNPQLHIY